MEHSPLFWALGTIAAALVGLSKGGLSSIGMLAVPVLSLAISPVAAAGLLLPVYVVSDVFGVWSFRHSFSRPVLARIIPGATLGVVLGWATATIVPERMVTGLVGVIGLVFALYMMLRRGPPPEAADPGLAPGLFWSLLSGFTSFVSHAGAPPYQVYVLPLRLPATVFAGTTTLFFAYVNAIKLVPYWFLGQLSVTNLAAAAVLMVPAVAAVFVGTWLVRRMSEKVFFRIVTWALLAVSVRLVWQAVAG